jgi:hypothetical protein
MLFSISTGVFLADIARGFPISKINWSILELPSHQVSPTVSLNAQIAEFSSKHTQAVGKTQTLKTKTRRKLQVRSAV